MSMNINESLDGNWLEESIKGIIVTIAIIVF